MTRVFSKNILYMLSIISMFYSLSSCDKQHIDFDPKSTDQDSSTIEPNRPDSNLVNLLAYKNSPHLLTVGYLTGDGADPLNATNPMYLPDSLDIACLFAGTYEQRQVEGWRHAQRRGIKLVVTRGAAGAYFDGSVNDPHTRLPGYTRPIGIDPNKPNIKSTYYHYAQAQYEQIILRDSLDGIDIDVEPGFFGGDCPAENAENYLLALAKFFGPSCTACKPGPNGKKPLFIYDTDVSYLSGPLSPARIYTPYKNNYDYILFQSYTTGNRAYSSGLAGLPRLVEVFGPEKLLFLTNGDSFLKADGSQDLVDENATATKTLFDYAKFVKDGNGGIGVGLYRMSRDYNTTPIFARTRGVIQFMNPAKR